MVTESVKKLSGKPKYLNRGMQCSGISIEGDIRLNKGYTKGEKIFIKINQTSSRGRLTAGRQRQRVLYILRLHAPKPGEACQGSRILVLLKQSGSCSGDTSTAG